MKVLDLASVSPSCFVKRLDDDDSRQVRCLRRRFIDFPSLDEYAPNRRVFYRPNKISYIFLETLLFCYEEMIIFALLFALSCKTYHRDTEKRHNYKFYMKDKRYFEVSKWNIVFLIKLY